MELPDPANISFPFVEMQASSEFIISKPPRTGGEVSIRTIKEQLLYEMSDPANYLSPDVRLSILGVVLKQVEKNKVKVTGAVGKKPSSTYKVSATYRDGFKAEGTLAIFGRDVKQKAIKCGKVILDRVKKCGYTLEKTCIEALGTGDLVPLPFNVCQPLETVLRVAARDRSFEAMECFVRHLAPMVTAGPPGVTSYSSGRPKIRPVFGYWPCLIKRSQVTPKIEMVKS
jgi:hypothetical protein